MSDQQQTTNLPNGPESFRTVPNAAEGFGNIPNDTESFRTVRNVSERKENHTLTVREAARVFEAAGVGRTERSIINWCQPNKGGIARLDSYFDPNERKYFISPQSVELAISEERAKGARDSNGQKPPFTVRKDSEHQKSDGQTNEDVDTENAKAVEQEVMDLKIMNKGKDYFIEQLRKEREFFSEERQGYVEKLMNFSRQIGELKTTVLRLSGRPGEAARLETPSSENQQTTGNP